MITGGKATVYLSEMDRAVAFYVERLGPKLQKRFGNHRATIESGQGLVIGLHPRSEKAPAPGTRGAISIGLTIDESIDPFVRRPIARGVRFHRPAVRDEKAGMALASFGDQDGNDLSLCEVTGSW